jgi:3-methyladenine DNA glycosylase Tag
MEPTRDILIRNQLAGISFLDPLIDRRQLPLLHSTVARVLAILHRLDSEGDAAMRQFKDIFAQAAERKGGASALEEILAETPSRSPATIAAIPDHRILAEMTRRIFCAGFSWNVVDDKWPAFEQCFFGFDPNACAFMTEEQFDRLMQDRGIVRNGAKIKAVQLNAQFLLDRKSEHGSAARFFADWPDGDYVGLLDVLKKRASHLGGDAAGRFLRAIGKPAFIATTDMVAALVREGVIDQKPGGKRDLAAVQAAFNQWSAESDRDLTAISRVLAMSIGSVGHALAHGRHH